MQISKIISRVVLLVLSLIQFGVTNGQAPYKVNPKALIAIKDVNIIHVENGIVSNNMTILIKGNRISKIGQTKITRIPRKATIIEGKNKFVIPGLWDMHAHTSSEMNSRNIIYPLFIANGITSARIMSADCIEPCRHPLTMNIHQSRALEREIQEGKLIGPRVILGSIYVNGAKPGDTSTVMKPGNAADGRKLVHLLLERGVDFIKIYDGVPRDAYLGIAEEARKEHFTFAGHNPISMKTSEVSDAGQKSIEHCCEGNIFLESSANENQLREAYTKEFNSDSTKDLNKLILEMVQSFDKSKCEHIFKKLKENHTYITPTLFVEEMDTPERINWRKNPSLKYLPKDEIENWEKDDPFLKTIFGNSFPEITQKRFEIVRDMQKAGIPILAGSDCGVYGVFYGESLHDELAILVKAGLTPLEALQSATITAAQYEDKQNSIGTIKKGMLADLILLDANPLENINNTRKINAVISNGWLFDRNALNKILENVAIAAAK